MTIRLSVDRQRWWAHVTGVAEAIDGLVPVIKGNGYGFGREGLAIAAVELGPLLAVGTVHELGGLPERCTPVVLTPTLQPPIGTEAVLTVGSRHHVEALSGWPGRVIVKLESSMHRFGAGIQLVEYAQLAGLRTVGVAIHPPLAGSRRRRRADIERWLPSIDPSLDVWVSHLAPDTYAGLPTSHRYKLRLGTLPVARRPRGAAARGRRARGPPRGAGTPAGYRQLPVAGDGSLVIVGAGSAGGVAALDGGRSPFHFARRRLALIEPPHMHTSMVFVPGGDAVPRRR